MVKVGAEESSFCISGDMSVRLNTFRTETVFEPLLIREAIPTSLRSLSQPEPLTNLQQVVYLANQRKPSERVGRFDFEKEDGRWCKSPEIFSEIELCDYFKQCFMFRGGWNMGEPKTEHTPL
jgi:hypothetical protein